MKIRAYAEPDLPAVYAHLPRDGRLPGPTRRNLYADAQLMGHIYSAPYALLQPGLALVVEDRVRSRGFRRRQRRHPRMGGPAFAGVVAGAAAALYPDPDPSHRRELDGRSTAGRDDPSPRPHAAVRDRALSGAPSPEPPAAVAAPRRRPGALRGLAVSLGDLPAWVRYMWGSTALNLGAIRFWERRRLRPRVSARRRREPDTLDGAGPEKLNAGRGPGRLAAARACGSGHAARMAARSRDDTPSITATATRISSTRNDTSRHSRVRMAS